MKRPAILKKLKSLRGGDDYRNVFVIDEKGEMYYVQCVGRSGYWVFKDRIEFTD